MAVSTGGGSKRAAWDLKGKVSDMEMKVQNYQSRLKGVSQENEDLKSFTSRAKVDLGRLERRNAELELELK